MREHLGISRAAFSLLSANARKSPNVEICGLLAGRDGIITRALHATNTAPNPAKSYDVSPKEIIEKMREIREANLEFLGVYHSHPNSANEPSPTDIELAAYPDVAYLILSPQTDIPNPIRAFSIREGIVTELTIDILD